MKAQPIEGLIFSAQGRYSDGYFSDDRNDEALRIGSYFLANAQVSYQWGPARIFASVTNIFDKTALLQRFGDNSGFVSDPREYGAGIEFRF